MDLKITDSSITLDSETGLYWLDIGQESSGFESIYYNMDGVERIFGNQMRILLEGVDISYSFKDSIIGVSDFF